MTAKIKPRPSERLQKFLDAYETTHAAAVAWGVEYQALNRFLNGTCGLSLSNAMQIAAKTNVPVDELFVEKDQP